MTDPAAPPALTTHVEPFHLHLEFQWDGGTFEEFETNLQSFSWEVPKFVYFSEPMSGFGTHLTLNAFETTISDRSGELVHALVGGVMDLHQSGGIDLGAHAQIDYRILQIHGAQLFLGIEGTVTADPRGGGGANVTFAPAFSIQFGGTVHPPDH
jgi:hypothetical protein